MRRQSDLNDIYGVKRIRSNPLEKDNEVAETGFRHSDAYHRYFRGYTEIRREKPNGRFSVERYYTQPWIIRAASGQGYWLTRFMYASFVFLSWMLYVWGMCMDLPSNRAWFVAVPGLPAVILLVLLSIVTLLYICAPRKMTLWEHASSIGRLKTVSVLAGGCMGVTALAKLAFLAVFGGSLVEELLSAGVVALAAAAAVALFLLEREAVYTTVPNDTVLPEGEAHEIW